jgi:competence protein ComEA
VVTQDERRALLFLAVVTAVGAALRAVRSGGDGAAAVAAVAPQLPGGDLARQAAASQRAESLARPLGPEEKVDLNRGTVEELDRLPRVGPALARRIVADRAANGPFRSLGELTRVTGVGPRLLHELETHVTFDGVPPLVSRPLPRPGAAGPATPARGAANQGCPERVEVNRATAAQLTCLPGVGPVLAERLVNERTVRGPFRDIGDLKRVPGLGAKRIARLADRVTIP